MREGLKNAARRFYATDRVDIEPLAHALCERSRILVRAASSVSTDTLLENLRG